MYVKTMKNRVSALFVALVMMLSLLSVGAIAWDPGEGIDVYLNGEKTGTVSYDTMEEAAQSYPDETYSNNKGVYSGKLYKFSKLLKEANASDAWSAASDDSTVVLTDAGNTKPSTFTKAELEETRYYYQDGNPVNTVKPGFLHVSGEEYFRFVIGQKDTNDSTSGRWVKLTGTGNAKLEINTTPAEPSDEPSPSNTAIVFPETVEYVTSDETNDYYRLTVPAELDNGQFSFSYSLASAKKYIYSEIQNKDGGTVDGATNDDHDQLESELRNVTLTGLAPTTDYRLFWNKDNSNGKLAKNVVLDFTTAEEAVVEKDGIEVVWNNQSVGKVNYEDMVDGISQASKTYNYSTVNSSGTYSAFNCAIYPFQQLMETLGKDADWEAAPDSTKVVFEDSSYSTELTKATLTEERYFFDDEGFRADTTKAGFKITQSNKGDYLQLVFGQKTKEEQTNGKFFKFKEPATLYITTPVFEVVAPDGTRKGFSYNDLDVLWQAEGSHKYTYTGSNTFPSWKAEEYYGPTLKAVLARAGIDLDALADNDVIRFDSKDGKGINMTVKEIRRTRYAFPNGKSTNNYQGTTEAQLEGKTEVPFILNISNGKTNIRNVFGQVDPQEQQMSYFIKYINKITVTSNAATEYTGLTPTIANGSKVRAGDKLNFDLDLPAGIYEGAIHYTVSTDGTEPADPTYSDTMYNWRQNQTDGQDYLDPEKMGMYNIYEFTDAPVTIIKVVVYVSGYTEPVVQTLRYENADTQEMTCELTSSEGIDLKAKKHTTLTAEISNGAVEDYTYKFIVYNKTTKQWYKLRDFEAANTFDWYTGPAGEKNLFVDVKAANGDVKRFQLDVNVTESDLAVKSFTISPEGVLPTKSQATLTAEAENGTAPYEFKFIVYNETTQQWYKLRDFEASNTFDWYTGPAGSKKLYVDVKDADGTVVRQELPVTVE